MEGGNENAPRQGRERGQGNLRKSVANLANLEFRSTGKSVKDMVTIFEGETTPSTTTNRGTRAASNASGSSQPGYSPVSSAYLSESPLARLSANHLPPKATTTGGQHPPANSPAPIVVNKPDDRKAKDPPAPTDPEGPDYYLALLMKQLDQSSVTSGGTTSRPSPPRQKPATNQQRRGPKEADKFWNNVRSQLHISDDELDDPPLIAESKRINALLDAADRADAEEEAKFKAAAGLAKNYSRVGSYSSAYSQDTVREAAATPPVKKEETHPLSLGRYRHLYDDTVTPPARPALFVRNVSPFGPPPFPAPNYLPPLPPTKASPTVPKSPEEKLSELDDYFQARRRK